MGDWIEVYCCIFCCIYLFKFEFDKCFVYLWIGEYDIVILVLCYICCIDEQYGGSFDCCEYLLLYGGVIIIGEMVVVNYDWIFC